MKRRSFLQGALAPAIVTKRRANVVVFMTDDHGAWAWGRGGCGDIQTPHMDRLAATGVEFRNAFAATPVCSPSRMTYMTGLLPSQHGVQDYLVAEDSTGPQSRRWLEGHLTYSEVLRDAGYSLGLAGKWHMGMDECAQAGFTWWATVPGGGGTYRNPTFVRNGESIPADGFKTDLQGDFALQFLDGQKSSKDPFYLLMPFYAPHTPFDFQPGKYLDLYAGAKFACYPRTAMHPAQNPVFRRHFDNRDSMLGYSALISGADANIGRVLEKLDHIGARENTLVVFTADQGWNAGHHGVWGKGNGTWPFNMYEESIRVPMTWTMPGRIRPGVCDALVSNYDYFDTILDFLDVPRPATGHRAGASYAPFLRGAQPKWRDRLYFEYCYTRAVRTAGRKLVKRTANFPSELYDLQSDPGETRNLQPGTSARDLDADLDAFFSKLGAPPIEDWKRTTRQNLFSYAQP